MAPRVSVLIPTYNCGRFLGEALESVLAQTFTDYEIIVVDDGSTDDTAQVVARYPQVKYVPREHSGVSAARNVAIEAAKGEFIAFLDADDLWVPDKLEKQVAYMDAHPDCQLVFVGVENFYKGDPDTMTQRQTQLFQANLDFNLTASCIRRKLFLDHGMFREELPYGEDTEWSMRICASGHNVRHSIPEPMYLRRIHDGNTSLTHEKVRQRDTLALLAEAIRRARKKE